MKKISQQQEGTIFLFLSSSIIWFFIIINNSHTLIESIIGGICFGGLSTLILALLFIFMKATFKW